MDYAIVLYLNQLAVSSPFLSGAAVFFAEYFPYLLLALFLVFAVRQKRNPLSISPLSSEGGSVLWRRKGERIRLVAEGFGAAALARGAVEVIRLFIERSRPFVNSETVVALLTETSYSFPSGHAAFFFALATVVFLHNRRWGWLLYGASVLIGLARVAAGVHYPTDILGGAAIGVAVGYGVHRLISRTKKTSERGGLIC